MCWFYQGECLWVAAALRASTWPSIEGIYLFCSQHTGQHNRTNANTWHGWHSDDPHQDSSPQPSSHKPFRRTSYLWNDLQVKVRIDMWSLDEGIKALETNGKTVFPPRLLLSEWLVNYYIYKIYVIYNFKMFSFHVFSSLMKSVNRQPLTCKDSLSKSMYLTLGL